MNPPNHSLAGAPAEVRLVAVTQALLDPVLSIEQQAYAHPWTRGNFVDAMQSGYTLLALMGGDALLGYWVAMQGVEEAHLLNITVDPTYQGQGWGVLLLDALSTWARAHQAQCVWLEVREGNARALQLYERYGYRRVGVRKNYYPAERGQREHAVVMSLPL